MRIMKKALLALVLCLIALCVAGLLPTPALAQEPKETNPPTILFIISGDESDSGNDGNTPENGLQPALEKYINKDVHQDLPAFDTPFTYEITSASAASLTIIARSDTGEAQAAVKRGQSVYRVYNSQTGTYHYTTREEEVNRLLKAGSKDGELIASTVSNSQPIQVPTGSAITAYDDDSVSVGPMIADQRQMLESALAADSSYTPNGVADIWAMISPDGEEKNVGPDEVDALVKQGWKRKYLVGQGTLLNGENGTAFFAISPADVIITGKAHVNAVVADTGAEGSTITVDSDTQVDNLVAAGDDTTVNIEGGAQVDKLEVAGDNVSVTIEAHGRVDEMMVDASGATIRIDGTVDQVIQTGSASGTVYSGTGTVTNAVMEAVSTGLSTLNCPIMVCPEGAGMIGDLMGDYTAVANPGYRFLGWVFNGTASVSLPPVLDSTSENLPMCTLETYSSLGSSPLCVIALFEKTDEASPSTDSKKTGMSLLAFITNGDEGQPEVTDPADTQEGPNSAEGDGAAAQPAGHEHIWDEWTQTKAPTCTEKGQETHTCQVEDCGETETREIDALGHNLIDHVAQDPTCTAIGWEAYQTCSRCDYTTYAEKAALGHVWGPEEVLSSLPGRENVQHFCQRCGTRERWTRRTNPQKICRHRWSLIEISEDPTCKEGWGKYLCDRCGTEEWRAISPNWDHDWSDWMETTAPTCTAKGQETRYCIFGCGTTETRPVDALAHTPVDDAAVPATCTEPGKTAGSHCSVCNTVIVAQQETDVDPAAHPADKIVEDAAVAATCTEKGKTAGTHCSACNAVIVAQQETDVDPAAHPADKIVEDAAVAATCTVKGKTAGSHCSACNAVIVAQQETDVDPAAHPADKIVEDAAVAATCTEKGKTAGTHCSACDAVIVAQQETDVDPAAHPADKIVEDAAVAATCTVKGKTAGSHCSACNAVVTAQQETDVDPAAHPADKIVEDAAVAATCTVKGKTAGSHCSACNAVVTAQQETDVDPAAHPADKIVEDAAVAATCTEKGKTAGSHCSACNAVVTAQQETDVDPAAHPADKIVEDAAVAATCTEKGKTAGKHCSVCNTVITAQEVIPAKGHITVDDAAVPATCTEPGKTAGSHCSVCNAVLVAQEIESALGHTGGEATCQAQAICTRCNQPYGDFGAHKMEEVEPAMEPSCENPGKTAYYRCSVCEEAKIPSEEYGTPLGHDWGAWSQTKAPTCTGKGEESHTCKRSGCGATETRPVDELGHAWATIWTQGETTHYHACTRDDCIAKNDEAEHSYNEDHECSVCGAPEPVFVVGE